MSAKEFAHRSKSTFSFQPWNICRNWVVNGITKRLRATKGNPVLPFLKEFLEKHPVQEETGIMKDIYIAQLIKCFHNHYEQLCDAGIFLSLIL